MAQLKSLHQSKVEEFMQLAGQQVPDGPCAPSVEVRVLRAKLIFEEAMETIRALGVSIDWEKAKNMPRNPEGEEFNPEEYGAVFVGVCISNEHATFTFQPYGAFNLVEVVDGCCDIKVVTTGTLSACGVADVAMQRLVDDNNLDKFGPGGYRADGSPAFPGPVGKWIKPPGHRPPDLLGMLKDAGYKEGE